MIFETGRETEENGEGKAAGVQNDIVQATDGNVEELQSGARDIVAVENSVEELVENKADVEVEAKPEEVKEAARDEKVVAVAVAAAEN